MSPVERTVRSVSQEKKVERTFRFACSSAKRIEGLQPRHVPPAEPGSELQEMCGDARLKARSTWGVLP